MSANFWECFGMGRKGAIKDIESYGSEDSAFGSGNSSERNSVNSLPSAPTPNKEQNKERPSRPYMNSLSFDQPCSSQMISTYENPGFVSIGDPKRRIRLIMAGDHLVGKTCLVYRLLANNFITRYGRTTEATKTVIRRYEDEKFYLQLIDLGGDRIKSPEELIEQADGIIFVYAADRPSSISLLEEIVKVMKYDTLNHVIPGLVLANKSDLVHKVPASLGQNLARKLNAPFVEVSAKSGDCVKQAFNELIGKLIRFQDIDELASGMRIRATRRTI